ncbi:helix-turn-helix domain-containing protein [Catalinimonas sp. 4WD22]|uniref:AraC family transcriptional regulator n=1 Tax=Catalinimonas locisalis TaxID=3133978 RepID=UPI0031016B9D
MELQPAPVSQLKFSSCAKVISGYSFLYSISEFDVDEPLQLVFPTYGFLILNFYTGENFWYNFKNYDFPKSQAYHLYIGGLFSQTTPIFEARGQGRGHAMKIHPVIGYHLFKAPMDQLTNHQHPISQLLGKAGKCLSTLEEDRQINILGNNYLEHLLLKSLPDRILIMNDPIYHAVNTIINRKGMIRIKELADQYCMSERTLNRQFIMKVGISPKVYAKMWQWQHVTELLQKCPEIKIEDLAFKTGYYDSAHLVHDFKEKTLQTPYEFKKSINPLIQDYLNFPQSLE